MTKRVRNAKQYKGFKKKTNTKVVYIEPENRVSATSIVIMVAVGIVVLAAIGVGIFAFINRPAEVKPEDMSVLDQLMAEADPKDIMTCDYVNKSGLLTEMATGLTNLGIVVSAKDITMSLKYLFKDDVLYLSRTEISIHSSSKAKAEANFLTYKEIYATDLGDNTYNNPFAITSHKIVGNDIVTTVDTTDMMIQSAINKLVAADDSMLSEYDDVDEIYEEAIMVSGIGQSREYVLGIEAIQEGIYSGILKCSE